MVLGHQDCIPVRKFEFDDADKDRLEARTPSVAAFLTIVVELSDACGIRIAIACVLRLDSLRYTYWTQCGD